MEFRPVERDDSEFNEGWRFGVAVGAAILLLVLLLSFIAITVGVLEIWISSLL